MSYFRDLMMAQGGGGGVFYEEKKYLVCYHDGTGSARINTGYTPNNKTIIDTTFKMASGLNSSAYFPLGIISTTNYYVLASTSLVRFVQYGSEKEIGTNISSYVKNGATLRMTPTTCTFGNATVTFSATTKTYPCPIFLFRTNRATPAGEGGTYTDSDTLSRALTELTIMEGTTLIKDFVPCVLTKSVSGSNTWNGSSYSAGTSGMIEKVSGIFYGNANTYGSLVATDTY